MRAHEAAGEPGRALAAYERLRETLAEELGADPARITRDLHEAILRERTATGQVVGEAAPTGPEGGFTGRRAELARLAAAWEDAVHARSRLVLLTGEAGIGKTSLAERAARIVLDGGGRVVSTRCFEVERSSSSSRSPSC
nr:hypothetical protein GCM10020093_002080 [Planobispora longispora]